MLAADVTGNNTLSREEVTRIRREKKVNSQKIYGYI